MSIGKQILISIVLLGLAGAAWVLVERRDLIFGADAGPSTPGPSTPGAAASGAPPAATPPAGSPPGAPSGGKPLAGNPPGGGAGPGNRGGGFGPPLVVAASVETDASGIDVRAIGTAAAARTVTVYPQVTGVVAAIAFTPGGEVAAGAPLVTLDDADQKVAVERAGIGLDKAKEAVARAEKLSKSGNVTAVTLSDAEVAERQAEIDLKSAELDLAKRTIRAPFAGTVGLSDLSVGDLVSTSKPIATIDDIAALTVAFDVPERVAGKIAVGQALAATTAALPGVTIDGKVSAVDSRIDPQTRTLRVEASLPNDSGILKPGMAIVISLAIPGEARPAVPSLAIQWDRKGSFVWRLDGDVAHRTPVQIIARRSGLVTVAGDLAAGDQVVVEGVLRLRDGATVARAGGDGARPPAGGPAAPGASAAASGGSG